MFKGKRRNRDKKEQPKADGRPPEVPNRKGSSDGSVSSANRVPSPSDGSNSKGSIRLSGSSSECSKTEDLTASRMTTVTRTRKGVKFAYVQVQEYERIISDNPSCSSGAPVG
jgi:hypothetical protein